MEVRARELPWSHVGLGCLVGANSISGTFHGSGRALMEGRLALQEWSVCLTHHWRKMGRDREIEETEPGKEVEPGP